MSEFPEWFHQFCEPGVDRFRVLFSVLREKMIPLEIYETGRYRHIQVVPPGLSGRKVSLLPEKGEKILLAHYDRFDKTPGANDNGASVLHLVSYLERPRRTRVPLRVIFTDGEELQGGQVPSDQGAYYLAKSWGRVEGLFPVVLDMTGIGDTFVLGGSGESLWRKENALTSPLALDRFAHLRLHARRILAATAAGDYVEINTPFSDDLGLLLAGFPAFQVSLLPRKQALAYQKLRAVLTDGKNPQAAELPPAWRSMHSEEDRLEKLWPSTADLVARFLEKLEEYPLNSGAL